MWCLRSASQSAEIRVAAAVAAVIDLEQGCPFRQEQDVRESCAVHSDENISIRADLEIEGFHLKPGMFQRAAPLEVDTSERTAGAELGFATHTYLLQEIHFEIEIDFHNLNAFDMVQSVYELIFIEYSSRLRAPRKECYPEFPGWLLDWHIQSVKRMLPG